MLIYNPVIVSVLLQWNSEKHWEIDLAVFLLSFIKRRILTGSLITSILAKSVTSLLRPQGQWFSLS